MKTWLTFISERFSPLLYIPMIAVFIAAHYALLTQNNHDGQLTFYSLVLIVTSIIVFFFKLRLYDEIKDYKIDCKIHPNRPLPRGLITRKTIKKGIVVCIWIELISFGLLGLQPFTSMVVAVIFSLFMYKEFFMHAYLRSHLTTYAVTHTAISTLLSITIYSALSSQFIWNLDPSAYFFALSSWCLFNIFEFGRKTFSSTEERVDVDSYSKIFTRYGAVLLVCTMSILSFVLLSFTPFGAMPTFWQFTISTSVILGIFGIVFAKFDSIKTAKMYRASSAAYIIVIYGGLIVLSLRTV